jgi:hypothetical protein
MIALVISDEAERRRFQNETVGLKEVGLKEVEAFETPSALDLLCNQPYTEHFNLNGGRG